MNGARSFVVIGLCSVVACERAPDSRSEVAPPKDNQVATATPTESIARTEPAPALPGPPAKAPRTTAVTPPAPSRPTPPRPAISVPRTTSENTASTTRESRGRSARADASDAELPTPPSDEPKEYADWLAHLPRAQQKRIAKFCRANPVTYEATCGGIGPLHIPRPPQIRAPVKGRATQHSESRFLSMEDWHQALTPAQVRYVERQCPGRDDQPSSDLCGENTPLVVAFENQPVSFMTGGTFAFQPGEPAASDWPTAKTPWIALDLDHDGAIKSGAELFGSSTILPDGTTARNGFFALAALDANHDGRIDASDPAFGSLLLWADRNGDQRSSPEELTALSSVIASISLDNHVEVHCDARANCERERATLSWRDARGEIHEGSVVDVYLPRR